VACCPITVAPIRFKFDGLYVLPDGSTISHIGLIVSMKADQVVEFPDFPVPAKKFPVPSKKFPVLHDRFPVLFRTGNLAATH
jgi:hypothetical protein